MAYHAKELYLIRMEINQKIKKPKKARVFFHLSFIEKIEMPVLQARVKKDYGV